MKNKIIILGFVLVVFLIASMGVVKSNEAEIKIEKIEEKTSDKKLDSVLEQKVNQRFMAYDAEFTLNNLIVVNEKGKIIGKAIIYTNLKELDSFYNNEGYIKTHTYENIVLGILKNKDSVKNTIDNQGIINVKVK